MIDRDPITRPLILTGGWLTRLIRNPGPTGGYRDLFTGFSAEDYEAVRTGRKRLTGDTEAGLALEDEPEGGLHGMG